MAALRSLKDEVSRCDQEVERILGRGIRNKIDLDALRYWQDKLNRSRDALRKHRKAA